jgi:hypothetical protein
VRRRSQPEFPELFARIRFAFRFSIRVARWFVLKPKIQIWVNFGGSCNGRRRCILWTLLWSFVIFYGDLAYVVRGKLVYFSPFWYFVPRKIWQTLFSIMSTYQAGRL